MTLLGTVEDPVYRLKLHELGKRIVNGCTEELTEEEVKPMCVRLAALEKLVAAPTPLALATNDLKSD